MFGYLVYFHWFAIINMNISVYTFMLHSILRIRINGSKNISLSFFSSTYWTFFLDSLYLFIFAGQKCFTTHLPLLGIINIFLRVLKKSWDLLSKSSKIYKTSFLYKITWDHVEASLLVLVWITVLPPGKNGGKSQSF